MRILPTVLSTIISGHLISFLLGAVSSSKTNCLATSTCFSNRYRSISFIRYKTTPFGRFSSVLEAFVVCTFLHISCTITKPVGTRCRAYIYSRLGMSNGTEK